MTNVIASSHPDPHGVFSVIPPRASDIMRDTFASAFRRERHLPSGIADLLARLDLVEGRPC